jgi:hypothetical protein
MTLYKYATFILTSDRMVYIEDTRAESGGWQLTACSLCEEYPRVPTQKKDRVRPSHSDPVSLHGLCQTASESEGSHI